MNDPNLEPPGFDVLWIDTDTLGTEPFSQFLAEYRANVDAYLFTASIVERFDSLRILTVKALLPRYERDKVKHAERIGQLRATANNPDIARAALRQHSNVMSMNLTNGVVAAFQRYFSSIVQAAALKRPSLLASAQQVRIDDVLRFTRHRDLVSFIVDRKVNELAYGGLTDLEKFFGDRLGVQMFTTTEERDLLRLFIEARNINVHNGGIVNEIFLGRAGSVAGFKYERGERFHIDLDALLVLTNNAMKVATHIDASVAAKFRLRRKADHKWNRK